MPVKFIGYDDLVKMTEHKLSKINRKKANIKYSQVNSVDLLSNNKTEEYLDYGYKQAEIDDVKNLIRKHSPNHQAPSTEELTHQNQPAGLYIGHKTWSV